MGGSHELAAVETQHGLEMTVKKTPRLLLGSLVIWAFLTYHSTCHAAEGAHGKNRKDAGKVFCNAAFLCKGHQKEESKIQKTGQQPPEETACFYELAGDQTSKKT